MIRKLKFSSKKEKIPTRSSKSQGLTKDNKIKLKGNKKTKSSSKSKSKSKKNDFKFLKLGKSSYPENGGGDSIFKRMAREDSDSDGSSEDESMSTASSASLPRRPRHLGGSSRRPSSMRPPPPDSDSDDDSDLSDSSADSFGSGSSGESRSSYPVDKTLGSFRKASKEEEEEAERQDLLQRLHILKQQGVRLSKNYTPRSSLAELRLEMGRLEYERETGQKMNRLRRFFMAGVSGMEGATGHRKAPNIIRGKLNGFSSYVSLNIHDYDPVFERMSERYGGVMGIGNFGNPLADLLFLLFTQIVLFIYQENRPSVRKPTEDEIKRDYPDMVRNVAKDMAYQLREEERQREMQMREQREQIRQSWIEQDQRHQRAQMYQALNEQQTQVQRQQEQQQMQMMQQQQQQQYQPQVQTQTLYHNTSTGQAPLHVMPEPSISLDFDVNTEEPLDVFKVDSIQSRDLRDVILHQPEEENLPVPPDANERVKIVEMPQPATNTRKGKEVKIQKPEPQQQKNEIVIS